MLDSRKEKVSVYVSKGDSMPESAPRLPTPIMFLGTFHFEDRGLDDYKPKSKFDVKARQAEVQEVVERLTAFKPTKIAVERRFEQQETLNREYSAFLQGELDLPGDEVYQLGF